MVVAAVMAQMAPVSVTVGHNAASADTSAAGRDGLVAHWPFDRSDGDVTVDVGHLAASEHPIEHVSFFVDGTHAFTDDEPPYRWTWRQPAMEGHTVKAVAHDAAGRTDSDAVTMWKLF